MKIKYVKLINDDIEWFDDYAVEAGMVACLVDDNDEILCEIGYLMEAEIKCYDGCYSTHVENIYFDNQTASNLDFEWFIEDHPEVNVEAIQNELSDIGIDADGDIYKLYSQKWCEEHDLDPDCGPDYDY